MGFILYSTLISMTISIIVLTILLGIVFYAVMWDAKLLDSVAMMEDGRYTRRMVVAQMIWNPVKATVAKAEKKAAKTEAKAEKTAANTEEAK